MYLDIIKGYRVTIGGYNAPLKEHRENTVWVTEWIPNNLSPRCPNSSSLLTLPHYN